MTKKIYDYMGVNLYQDYILPTNPASKNPIIKKLAKNLDRKCGFSEYSLKKRLIEAYIFGGVHVVLGIIFLLSDTYPELKPTLSESLKNILANVYPILVQLKTGNRIHKILKHKQKKNLQSSQIININENIITQTG